MATRVEGVALSATDWTPLASVVVNAYSVTGQTQGSDTTDSNGHFVITGLTNRSWLAKLQPTQAGRVLVFFPPELPISHSDLNVIAEDQHHNRKHLTQHHTGGDDAMSLDLIAGVILAVGHGDQSGAAAAIHNHADLGSVTVSQHHTKYTDASAISAVEGEAALVLTSLTIPNADAPTVDAVGELALDTLITSHDDMLTFFDSDSQQQYVVSMLLADMTVTDNHVIVYDSATSRFKMEAQAGGGSGSMTTVKEGGSQVGGADIVTLDFGPGFDVAETPDTEINITLDLSELAFPAWSDTGITGAELETLSDTSDADALHAHTNHGVTHNAVHGISAHTEHATHKLLYTDGSGDEQELSLGADGQVLKATGASAAPAFEDDIKGISFTIDGGGSVITTGIKGVLVVPFACTITAWYIVGDASGSINVDVNRSVFQATPSYSSIAASAHPLLSSAITNSDTTLTGWTTTLAAQDIIQFEVDGTPTTVKLVTILLKVKRT